MADPFNQDPYNLTKDPLTGGGTYGEGRIGDALQRLRGLQSALQSGQIDYDTYNKLFQQFDPQALQLAQSIGGGGSKAATAANNAGAVQLGQLSNLGGQDLSTFASQFKNLTGKSAGGQDFTNYFGNIQGILGNNPTSYADVNTAINQYLQNTYQPEIQAFQKQQQTGALQDAQKQAQDLITQQNQQTVNQLTSPQVQEQFKQAYNKNGLLNSGAFSEGLGNTLANAASGNISSALGGITIPGITGIEGTTNAPYQQFLGNLNPNLQQFGQNQNEYNQFNLQKDLAEQLSGGGASNLEKWSPIIQGLLQGGGMAASGKTYLCTHLKKMGLMTQDEVRAVHRKIFPYAFLHPIELIMYSLVAPSFIAQAAEHCNWSRLKRRLCDDILRCKSSRQAYHRYKAVCEELFFGKAVLHGS